VNRLGPKVEAVLERPGFYPAGGGRFRVVIHPSQSLVPFDLVARGAIHRRGVYAVVAGLPEHIARRETARVLARLTWSPETAADWWRDKRLERPQGPGNVVLVEIASEMVTEVFTGFGEKVVPAETVADAVVDEVREYLASDVPVGRHLADQLLIPFAMAVGQHAGAAARYRTLPPTRHTTTNIAVIRTFLDVDIQLREVAPRSWEIQINRKGAA
jgi:RNA 3'-terminal phosphate cyclase (ATP)